MAESLAVSATALLRPGLLQGVSLLLAGPPAPLGSAVAEGFAALGARVSSCLPDGEDEAAIDTAVAGALADAGAIEMLIVDGAGLFGAGAPLALRACLDAAWNVTRAVVNTAFLPAGAAGASSISRPRLMRASRPWLPVPVLRTSLARSPSSGLATTSTS